MGRQGLKQGGEHLRASAPGQERCRHYRRAITSIGCSDVTMSRRLSFVVTCRPSAVVPSSIQRRDREPVDISGLRVEGQGFETSRLDENTVSRDGRRESACDVAEEIRRSIDSGKAAAANPQPLTANDAVPAQSWARVEAHETEGFGFCCVEDIPDVDAEAVVDDLEFVDEGDVDGSEDVLGELCGLGDAGRGDADSLSSRSGHRGPVRGHPIRYRLHPRAWGCWWFRRIGCRGLRVRGKRRGRNAYRTS